jgi:hypothetical protein
MTIRLEWELRTPGSREQEWNSAHFCDANSNLAIRSCSISQCLEGYCSHKWYPSYHVISPKRIYCEKTSPIVCFPRMVCLLLWLHPILCCLCPAKSPHLVVFYKGLLFAVYFGNCLFDRSYDATSLCGDLFVPERAGQVKSVLDTLEQRDCHTKNYKEMGDDKYKICRLTLETELKIYLKGCPKPLNL